MDQRTRDDGLSGEGRERVIVRRPLWARIAMYAAIGVLVLLVVAIAFVWVERRTIATHFLKGEFEQRGVRRNTTSTRWASARSRSATSLSATPSTPI